jgi:hypothetical protein
MTRPELQGLAAQALNMARREIEQGSFHFLLAAYHEGETPPVHRMDGVEKLIIQRLGENWLNSGRTKAVGFGVLRIAVDLLPPDGIVLVTSANYFKPTAKFKELTEEERRKLVDAGHDRHHEAVKGGVLELCDSLLAIAQTPQEVCHYVQVLEKGRPVGVPEVLFCPQEAFSGRCKMYGAQDAQAD